MYFIPENTHIIVPIFSVPNIYFLIFPLCGNTTDKPLHSVCTLLFHLICHMTVHIQSECSGGMAKIFLHSFDVITRLYGDNCIGVAQIMEASMGATNIRNDFFEVPIDDLRA